MTKTKYFAIDRDGFRHTRNSDRVYLHSVVYRGGYEQALARAGAKGWTDTDRSNFRYYAAIASGNDPHPPRYCREAPKWNAEQIAEERTSVDEEQAKRLTDAVRRTNGHTVDSYCEAQRLARIAHVETMKAVGDFDRWHCAGWNGRLDLAHTLAAASAGSGYETDILEARS